MFSDFAMAPSPQMRHPTRLRVPVTVPGVLSAIVVALASGTTSCVLVMDSDFDKYRAAASDESAPDASVGGMGGAPEDAAPEADGALESGVAGMGGKSGMGGGAGMGGDAGMGGNGGTTPPPTCTDGLQNQGEKGIDCGGPCPPCPSVGFSHLETFNMFPSWGPDGPYTVAGTCADDEFVDGWGISNVADGLFTRANGLYAAIDTDKLVYAGLLCDDSMFSPEIDTREATAITIEFDSSLDVLDSTTASVWLVRDGTAQQVWSESAPAINQHVEIGPVPANGAAKISVFFRYEAMYEFYWKVDNVRIEGS